MNAGDDEESNDEEQEIIEVTSDEGMDSGWDVRDRSNKDATAGNGNAFATGGMNRTRQGGGGGGGGKDDSVQRKQMFPYLWEVVEELSKDHPSVQYFGKAFGLLEEAKARAIEEKIQKFRMSAIRHQLGRMDLMKETVTMVFRALEGAD